MTGWPGTCATTSAWRASQNESTPVMKISSISRESDVLRIFADQSTSVESSVTYRTAASFIEDIASEDSDIPLRTTDVAAHPSTSSLYQHSMSYSAAMQCGTGIRCLYKSIAYCWGLKTSRYNSGSNGSRVDR